MAAAAILKIAFLHNSSIDCPISAKFCMRKQNGMSTRAKWQNLQIFKIQNADGRIPNTVTWPKTKIFKIQGGGNRHLANCFFGHNSSTDCLISAKFCNRKQNGMPTKATWQKLQILKSKMADGRHFEIVKSPYLSEKSSGVNEIWYTTADVEPDYSHVTNNWNC